MFPPFETTKTTTVAISLDVAGGTWIMATGFARGFQEIGGLGALSSLFGSVGASRMPTTMPHK